MIGSLNPPTPDITAVPEVPVRVTVSTCATAATLAVQVAAVRV